ncbi:hypothetical protein SAMN05444000_1442 [Shimia gijangensis]|uniref:Uncharacterized protein n=1 Tax=Shimia gijangensis TaxID=1470563 RepID=A0A1M6TRH3_9RHOB|nr:hypothetical protein SAMN05444000_1442 [Shimia gijangensis]
MLRETTQKLLVWTNYKCLINNMQKPAVVAQMQKSKTLIPISSEMTAAAYSPKRQPKDAQRRC